MFDRFDFGKSLEKQVEAYKRLSLQAQKRREPNLVKYLDAYTKKYMSVVNNPGAANPGLLKNGAEALVEAAEVLQEGRIVYEAFAEMVGKSRKVPVVPGLAALVDRLLEVPTPLNRERVALLNWRITTGNMRPERHLKYLSERANLSGEVADWKDYSWGVSQLLKKEAIKLNEDVTVDSLKELLDNKVRLGDRAAQVQMMMAESLLERKNPRQAESYVIEMIGESETLPEAFAELVERLIEARNETAWELHRLVLIPSIAQFMEGKLNAQAIAEMFTRSHKYTAELVGFMLDNPAMPRNERLSVMTLERILPSDPDKVGPLIERYRQVHKDAAVAVPDEAEEMLRKYQSTRAARESAGTLGKTSSAAEELLAAVTREMPVVEPAPPPVTEAPAELAAEVPAETAAVETVEEPVIETPAEVAEVVAEPVAEPAALEPEVVEEPVVAEAIAVEAAPEPQAEEDSLEPEPVEVVAEAEETPKPAADVNYADDVPDAEPLELIGAMPEPESGAAVAEPVEADAVAEVETPAASAEPAAVEEPVAASAEEPAAEPEATPVEAAPAAAELPSVAAIMVAADDVRVLIAALEEQLGDRLLSDAEIETMIHEIAGTDAVPWAGLETSMWLAAKLYIDGDQKSSTRILSRINVETEQDAQRVAKLVHETSDGKLNPEQRELLVRLALVRRDYDAALADAFALPQDWEGRSRVLADLANWLGEHEEGDPQMMLAHAMTLREQTGNPAEGFGMAVAAALLAPDNRNVQNAVASWAQTVEPATVHGVRAEAASRMCAELGRSELLPVALSEIELLAGLEQEGAQQDAFRLIEALRPVIDSTAGGTANETRRRWTRLYLLTMIKTSDKEQIPGLLTRVTAEMEPEETLTLVEEIGEALPASARFTVHYESLVRKGDWEQALELIRASERIPVESAVPVRMLANHLNAENAVSATERLSTIFTERGDHEGSLELVKEFGQKLAGGGNGKHVKQLRKMLDDVLAHLCDGEYEPAVRYRLSTRQDAGDYVTTIRDLLALARQRDSEALTALIELFPELLNRGGENALVRDTAQQIAMLKADSDPDLARRIIGDAGRALGELRWAMNQLEALGLSSDDNIQHYELGKLSLEEKNYDAAVLEINALISRGDWIAARELNSELLNEQPELEKAQLAMIRIVLSGDQQDARLATGHLLKLAHIYQRRDINPTSALAPLKAEVEAMLLKKPGDLETQHLQLALAALTGEYQRVTELVDELVSRDPKSLLRLFEELALDDTDLPSPLVVAWGRALFKAGRIDDALNRLAGLREAVGDYPEYIALLEEIKNEGGGPGACMQLGEAYLRVHLWQRSAEEYATALDLDESLAEPILTQLRHHAALDPNPMKYPLHLLGLRAVAASGRQADWGWAISALTWLLPRWNAEELYGLARRLWEQHDRGELMEEQQSELLLHLFRLASRLGRSSDALEYLSHAWEMSGEPTADLVRALGELDREGLGDNQEDWIKLRRYELQAAMQHGDTEKVITAANELASTALEGRRLSLDALANYRRQTPDQLPILLARLKLLDLSSAEGRDTFVSELLAAADTDLPTDQARSLIRTVLELIEDSTESPELTKLLLQLFRQMGDEARAWQLAKNFVQGQSDPTPAALDMMQQLAASEFAQYQQISLVETHMVRREFEQAAQVLERIKPSELSDNVETALRLAEALLGAPGGTLARRWLIGCYRMHGRLEQAADHLVWAHAASDPQPADWLHEETSGDLMFRSGQLYELQGNTDQALRRYEEAYRAKPRNTFTAAAVCSRLSNLHEQAGNLAKADKYAQEAVELLPGRNELRARVVELELKIKRQRIIDLHATTDSAERTLSIAILHRECGELDEAISELQGGIGRGQTLPAIYIELAECFNETGDFNIARRAFTEVINKLESTDGDAELRLRGLYGLATTEERLANRSEAIRCIEQILVVRHNYLDSRQRLEKLYSAGGSPAPATPVEKSTDAKQEIVSEILSLLDLDSDETKES